MKERKRGVVVRLTTKEKNHLKEQAALVGLKMEPFVRKLIMQESVRPRPPDEYRKVLFELSAIGNNINQIAHIANAERHISSDKLNEAVSLVDKAISHVRSLE